MKRLNVLVSEESRLILREFQKENKISTLDDTVDIFIKRSGQKDA